MSLHLGFQNYWISPCQLMRKTQQCHFILAHRSTPFQLIWSWVKSTHVISPWLPELLLCTLSAHGKRQTNFNSFWLSNLLMGNKTHVTSFDFRNCNFNFKSEISLYFYFNVATKFLFPESNVAATSNKSIHFPMNCITCWIHILIFVFFFIFLLPDF